MSRNGQNDIPRLTSQYFDLMRRLNNGYPTQREKLDAMFFDVPDDSPIKVVVTKYFEREEPIPSDPKTPPKEATYSTRLFSGRATIWVIYPRSGKRYLGRIRVWKDLAAIEPVKSNLAFWVIERKYLDNNTVIDLNVIPHIRQYHNKAGREFLSEFR